MIEVKNAQKYTSRFILPYRDWESNEECFDKVRAQLINLGDVAYYEVFNSLDNYIRWKGKEDSAVHSGKSMLGSLNFIVEIYRLMWIVVFEMWTITEERNQFNIEEEYKHEILREFEIYNNFKELVTRKFDRIQNLISKKNQEFEMEQNIIKMAQGMNVIDQIQNKLLNET